MRIRLHGVQEGFKTEEKQKEWDTLEKNRQELWAKGKLQGGVGYDAE